MNEYIGLHLVYRDYIYLYHSGEAVDIEASESEESINNGTATSINEIQV